MDGKGDMISLWAGTCFVCRHSNAAPTPITLLTDVFFLLCCWWRDWFLLPVSLYPPSAIYIKGHPVLKEILPKREISSGIITKPIISSLTSRSCFSPLQLSVLPPRSKPTASSSSSQRHYQILYTVSFIQLSLTFNFYRLYIYCCCWSLSYWSGSSPLHPGTGELLTIHTVHSVHRGKRALRVLCVPSKCCIYSLWWNNTTLLRTWRHT